MAIAEVVAESLCVLDTAMFGLPRYGALYILKAPRPAIIETGFSYTLEKTLQALDEFKIHPKDVAYIMPTHIHLDHAGGTGHLAEACPNAKVVVHEQGAPHLSNPIRLLESVKRAVGPMFAYYGTLKPISRERIISVHGSESFNLGAGYEIVVIDAPGHAPHQVCYYERKAGGLFTGDAVGIYRPWVTDLMLTTPPPAFHLEQSLGTLARLQALQPKLLLYTHWGAHTDLDLLNQYSGLLRNWVSKIEAAKIQLFDDQTVKEHFVQIEISRLREHYPEVILRGEIDMNVQGVLLYLKKTRSIT